MKPAKTSYLLTTATEIATGQHQEHLMSATRLYHRLEFQKAPPRRAMTEEQREEGSIETLYEEIRRVKRAVIAMTIFAVACVMVSLGTLLGSKTEERAMATMSSELTKRVNKLTAEVALKDARFQSSKGVMQNAGKLEDLLAIQQVIDRYALVELHNGNSQGKTGDEVRREACDQLAKSALPCIP
jgi:hypothetical protein